MVNSGSLKFITYTEPDINGKMQFFVLQKDFPHYVGVIKEYPEVGNWVAVVPSHNLWVTWVGTLRGSFIPSYSNASTELQSIIDEMADWYYKYRILNDEKRYKKFKINV